MTSTSELDGTEDLHYFLALWRASVLRWIFLCKYFDVHAGGRSSDMEHSGDHRISGDHSSEHHDLDGLENIRHDDIASGLPFIPIALVRNTDVLSAAARKPDDMMQ